MPSNGTNVTVTFCKTVSFVDYSLAIGGIFSNILIPLTVLKSEKLRCKSAGILMIALACADSLCLICKIILLLGKYELDIPGFVAYFYIFLVAKHTSHILVVMTAINRYAIICHPHTHHYVTSKKGVTIQIFTSLILAILGNLYFVFLKLWNTNETVKIGFSTSAMLIFNILPYFVTTFLSVMVFRSIKKRQRKLRTQSNRTAYKMEIQLTHAMISVVIAFITLSVPWILFRIIHRVLASSYNDKKHRQISCLLGLFRDINFGINFYLYLMYYKMFRYLFCKLLHLRRQQIDGRSPSVELVEL